MIFLEKKEHKVFLAFHIYLINLSSKRFINLYQLADVIKKQLDTVYNSKYGNTELTCEIKIRPLYTHSLKNLYGKLVFAVVDTVTHDNVAEADFGGLLVKLNAKYIKSFITGANVRTIPHEVGHLLGFDHPHARAMYDSVNPQASIHEQNMTNEERRINLMSQTWYIQKAGNDVNTALHLTESQIQLLIENFEQKKLNKNYSIVKGMFWYKWIGKM
jgi:hypothetical protein